MIGTQIFNVLITYSKCFVRFRMIVEANTGFFLNHEGSPFGFLECMNEPECLR